jgi:hypothetical protein
MKGESMNIRTIKHFVLAVCFIVLTPCVNSADELYTSELSGLAFIHIPFDGHQNNLSPTFGFAIERTQTTDFTYGIADGPDLLFGNHNRKTLFDIEYDLVEQHWSRFGFGGINALVYDDVLHANGGGPTLDPTLLVLGIGTAGALYIILNNDDDPPHECNEEPQQPNGNGQNNFRSISKLHEPCELVQIE